jgi:chitin synthase
MPTEAVHHVQYDQGRVRLVSIRIAVHLEEIHLNQRIVNLSVVLSFTGEDRWLCTLLLKQKYRVEYCAASDAMTFAPEGFYEFYNQRRRWAPSTMANILDLLLDGNNVRKVNQNISRPYIFYHIFLFVSSILTPGTIFLLILGAITTAFTDIEPWLSLLLNGLPVTIFIISIYSAKEETQVHVL